MMRLIAGLGLIIAASVIGVCCVYLGGAAYNAAPDRSQAILTTAWVVPLAIWEALAVTAATVLWKHGYKPLAPIAILSLVGALALTARYDVLAQTTAQADRMAGRSAIVSTANTDRAQLEALTKQQSTWMTALEGARGRPTQMEDIQGQIDAIATQIRDINAHLETKGSTGSATPDADFLAGLMGGNARDWVNWQLLGMVAGLAALRVLLLPVAVAFSQIIARNDPHSERERHFEHLVTMQNAAANDRSVTLQPDAQPAIAIAAPKFSHDEIARKACEALPFGSILRKNIEAKAGELAKELDVAVLTREQLGRALKGIGVERDASKKNARGAIYINHLGIKKPIPFPVRNRAVARASA